MHPRLVKKPEPNQELIRHLQGLLQSAKDGDIIGAIEVCEWRDGSTSSGWSMPTKGSAPMLLGELMMLATNLTLRIDGVKSEDIK